MARPEIIFKDIELSDSAWIRELLSVPDFNSEDYNFTFQYLWKNTFKSKVARIGDIVLVQYNMGFGRSYLMPVGKAEDWQVADLISSLLAEDNKIVFYGVLPQQLEFFEKHFSGKYTAELFRMGADYIYDAESLKTLRGKKYQSSTLDEDDKVVITERIFKLFEDSEEYLATDFNLNKLAELVGSNYKNVSQVVNENFKKNFNTLLNEYRIKEACRRMGDLTHYGNYTIEAIGESVGFGSRSTFISTFKKITGLTPSEYQRQVRA